MRVHQAPTYRINFDVNASLLRGVLHYDSGAVETQHRSISQVHVLWESLRALPGVEEPS